MTIKKSMKKAQTSFGQLGYKSHHDIERRLKKINLSKPAGVVGAVGVGAYIKEGIDAVRNQLQDAKRLREKREKETNKIINKGVK